MKRVLFFADFTIIDTKTLSLLKGARAAGDELVVAVKSGDGHEALYVDLFSPLDIVTKALAMPSAEAAVSSTQYDIFARSAAQSGNDFMNACSITEASGKEVLVLPYSKSGLKPYRIGYTCGVFDLFHIGHLNLLERCKTMCDYLMVGVCDDDYVRQIKKTKPIIELEDRVRILNALEIVDEAFPVNIEETQDKVLALSKFNFDVLFSGDDWKGSERYLKTEEQFAALGASIEYFPYTAGISTSDIKVKMDDL